MRGTRLFFSIAMTLLTAGAGRSVAATFGTVVPIGGTPSDIALDEPRNALYIADFGCACIDVMSLVDNTIHTSINVAPFPVGIALSPSGQYLVSVHYDNGMGAVSSPTTAAATGGNLVTVIDLNNNQAQTTYALGESPLGVSFVNTLNGDQGGLAVIATNAHVLTLDPETGEINILYSVTESPLPTPQPAPNSPSQFTQAAVGTSGDGWTAWVVFGGGTGLQPMFWYNAFNGSFNSIAWTTTPALEARVSVSGDGSHAMIGWAQFNQTFSMVAEYPNNVLLKNVTGHAWDSINNILYAQIPDAAMATGTPLASSNQAAPIVPPLPALLVMDGDNLTFRERLTLQENLVGRAVLNKAVSVMYAVSDSGVTILPVGSLNQYNRVEPGQEDVLVQTGFCNQSNVSQTFTLADPGGNHTDFELTPGPGILVSPSSGVTPATITVIADSAAFAGALGTSVVPVKISSASAVNQPIPVRVLVSNPDENQRGTIVNVPGVLSDIVADTSRNRFYITRQDRNKVLVYDGATSKLLTSLRTATTPTGMAMTQDQNYLLVANADSQLVSVFDLNALQPVTPITLTPDGSDFGRSIAVSNSAVLALSKDGATSNGDVAVLDLANKVGISMPTLGPWTNDSGSVSPKSVLTASPNGADILMAGPDGHVYLYSAAASSFVAARQDYTALSGAYGASSYDNYVVGSAFLNSSLVPMGAFNTAGGNPSGFAFIDQNNAASGYFLTTASASSPGTIQLFSPLSSASESPIPMVEAPLLPFSGSSPTGGTGGASTPGYPSPDGTVSNNGSGTNAADQLNSFIRTVAPLPSANEIIVLSTSGFTILSQNYAASFVPPVITSIVNAANGTAPVAPGGLITVWGTNMSPVSLVASQVPLPTALGQSCLSVNGTPVPLLFVSSTQVNAQLPDNVLGPSTVSIHTPGGVSNSTHFTVQPAAPAVFMSGSAGPTTGLATVVRAANNQLVTPTNPIRPGDTLVIYLTGMGLTTPGVIAGVPAPVSPLALASDVPTVTLGGSHLDIQYAGLAPGEIGVYQINAVVPGSVTQGLSEPLVINQGSAIGANTTLNERVVGN
ncbi:MAG: hypothetical protein ABSE35_02165 [Bryobacteraceae bacterium]